MNRSERNGRPGRRSLVAAGIAVAVAVAVAAWLVSGAGRSTPSASAPTQPVGPAPVGPPAQPAPATQQLGANVNRLFNDQLYGPGQIDTQLAALRATGATVARSDALWEPTEPAPPVRGVHRYEWRFDDLIARSLAAQGLRWLPILDYSPPWTQSVRGQDHSPPRSAVDYAAYAGAFAARYGPGGTFWRDNPRLSAEPIETYEIWNEPDNPAFFTPKPDAATYDEMYLRARDAITAVDPSARVIVGGLTDIAAFLPAMLRARPDMRGHIDGIAIHPYGPTPEIILKEVRTARQALYAAGLASLPLYVTEFGWTTRPAGALDWTPARVRPRLIAQTITDLAHSGCGLAGVFLYTWVTPQLHPDDPQDWFGIHPPGGGATPDTAAFKRAVAAARARASNLRVCSGSTG